MMGYGDRNIVYEVWGRSYRNYWENNKSKNHTVMGRKLVKRKLVLFKLVYLKVSDQK